MGRQEITLGRSQFSVEKAKTVRARIPQEEDSSITSVSARYPASWPADTGSRLTLAHLEFPSMMTATCLGIVSLSSPGGRSDSFTSSPIFPHLCPSSVFDFSSSSTSLFLGHQDSEAKIDEAILPSLLLPCLPGVHAASTATEVEWLTGRQSEEEGGRRRECICFLSSRTGLLTRILGYKTQNPVHSISAFHILK